MLLPLAAVALASETLVARSGSIQEVLDNAVSGDIIDVPTGWAGPDASLSITDVSVEIVGQDPSAPPTIPSITVSSADHLTLRDLIVSTDGYGENSVLLGYGSTTFAYGVYADGVDLELHGVQLLGGSGYGVLAIDGSVSATDLIAMEFDVEPAMFVLAATHGEALDLASSTFWGNAGGAVRSATGTHSPGVTVTGEALTFSANGSEALGKGADLRLEDVASVDVVDVISEYASTSPTSGIGGAVYLYSTQPGPFAFADVWIRDAVAWQGRAIDVQGDQNRTSVTFEDVLVDDTTPNTTGFGPLYLSFVHTLSLDKVVVQGSVTQYGAVYIFQADEVQVTDTAFNNNSIAMDSGNGAALTVDGATNTTFTRLRLCGNSGTSTIVRLTGSQSFNGLIAQGNVADQVLEPGGDTLAITSATFNGNVVSTADVGGTMSSLYLRNVLFGDSASGVWPGTIVGSLDYDYLFSIEGQAAVHDPMYPYPAPDHPQVAADPRFDTSWDPLDCARFPVLGLGSVAIDNGDPASPTDPDGSVADIGAMTGQAGSWWIDGGRPTGDAGTVSPDTGHPDTGHPDTGHPDTALPDSGDTGRPDSGWDPSDRDGDGYAVPGDCNDARRGTHPGAWDIPDDGQDQDCDGGDATRQIGGGCGCSSATDSVPWSILSLLACLPLARRRR